MSNVVKVLSVCLFAFTVSACGGDDTYNLSDGSTQGILDAGSPAPTSTPEPTPAPTPTPEPTPTPTPEPQKFSALLSWTAPTSYSDGSPMSLSEIGGYKIYYGQTTQQYSHSIDVADGSAVSQLISDLSAGTYYFTVATYDTNGITSTYAREVEATF